MYICACICIHIYMYVCKCVYVHACMHACVCYMYPTLNPKPKHP